MRTELKLTTNDQGLTSQIRLRVPRGQRDEGLDLLARMLPAIRALEQCSRHAAQPVAPSTDDARLSG